MVSRTVPAATNSTNTMAPSIAALTNPWSTAAPPITVGMLTRGSAVSVAVLINEAAVRPEPTVAESRPRSVSNLYCIAPPAAAPAGTILPNALPLSCAVATRKMRRVRSRTA